ncbi:alanine racemase [Moraxella marmotae]|uniref:alanine racemase n=1 Tax=Moraxella marmotae TaxID=3344520 RepID=UPI0035F30ADF
MRTATVTIHQDALVNNLQIIKDTIKPTTKVLAMVKANAYGHGVDAAVPALLSADGFGVACLSEAMAVEKALNDNKSSKKPIVLIEGVFSQDEWQTAILHDFGCVVHCQAQLNWAIQNLPNDDSFCRSIWLKYNTGMNRLGFDDDGVIAAAKTLHQAGYRLILTTHFSCADDKDHPLNAVQIDKFNTALASIRRFAPDAKGSLCNSAGIFHFKEHHHDWVRAGIALYGSKPIANQSAKALGLKPAMTLSAQVMAIHTLPAGSQVGYGALWTTTKSQQIAVVSIGYGDGYPRVLDNASVAITDKQGKVHQCPIIGRVAMDMFMVDIDGLQIDVGAKVVLWGQQPSIDEIADCANTIGYELMCRLTARPSRQIEPLSAQFADQ